MAYGNRGGGNSAPPPRNRGDDPQFQDALRAHAQGAVDVILAIATQRNVSWQDALDEYPAIFDAAKTKLLDRINQRRGQR